MSDTTEINGEQKKNITSKKNIEYYVHISGSVMQSTRGSRFMSAQLLVLKERASLLIISTLAIFLVGISVLLLVSPNELDATATRHVGILSTVASVAVLAITLFDYALGRGLLAAKLHDGSLRITELMREMERELAKDEPSLQRLEACAAQYEAENISTNVNHSTVDFTLYKISRADSKCIPVNFIYRAFSVLAQVVVVAFAVAPGLIALAGVLFYAYRVFG